MKINFLISLTTIFLIAALIVARPVSAQVTPESNTTEPTLLPVKPNTIFYLTGTPKTHTSDGSQAAIDFQIIDQSGFIDKGAELYSPINGYARYIISDNGSALIEITQTDKKWRVLIAHVLNDTEIAKQLNSTYPKHVAKGELIGFQGNSGRSGDFAFPTHVHYEIAILEDVKDNEYIYTSNNAEVNICTKLKLAKYCKFIDEGSQVVLIYDR